MAKKEERLSHPNQGFLESLTNESSKTRSNAIEAPQISLPKGGGALKGIDEKFQVNAANGTASFSIPLPASPSRNGFGPQLSLSYNSGSGNSLFGIGWDLDLPMIRRGTDNGLPRYRDADLIGQPDDEDHLLLGNNELVPFLDAADNYKLRQFKSGLLTIRQYRPRIEGDFSRIERIHDPEKGYYWRVTTRENITTWFGYSASCRIVDPHDKDHIYSWLPEITFDHKGSWIRYEYKPEDLTGVVNELAEKNRFNKLALFANTHLKRIKYGNQLAFYPAGSNAYIPDFPEENAAHHFELVFDYGEHDEQAPGLAETNSWLSRKDAYSFCRSGFEIRNYRLCKRILMFHIFPELNNGKATLVGSMDFDHQSSDHQSSGQQSSGQQTAADLRPCELAYLTAIVQKGYVRKPDGTYSSKAMPAITFDYQWLTWNTEVKTLSTEDLIQSPVGLWGDYQWVDLYSEGISGILTEQASTLYYKENLGEDGQGKLRFGSARPVSPRPALAGMNNGVLQLADLESNGTKQLVVMSPQLQGYFELDETGAWQPFRAFLQKLNISLKDPNIRMVDLNGDGRPEILFSDQGAFWWWENKGKLGYDTPELATKGYNDEKGPALIFADQENRIFLADMTGDGLTDLVRISYGEVCYWSNLGYGNFGAKVSMGNPPVFDSPDLFNPAYIRLVDISGTGAADLIYLGKNKFRAYLNFSGNSWSEATEIDPFFSVEQPNEITVTDLLGNGTAAIVWSSPLPSSQNSPMRYIDLMGGKKPHIMCSYENGFGKKTAVSYKSSTWYYLEDKRNGRPWITRLAFPVQCVSETIITERVTNARFTAQYTYHHGYFDAAEREFRGFGRVDQTDTEEFEVFARSGASNLTGKSHYQPPVLIKTWYHTGCHQEDLLQQFQKEYWYEELKRGGLGTGEEEYALPATALFAETAPAGFGIAKLSGPEFNEAMRACKGMVIRQEIFGLDAGIEDTAGQQKRQATPYTVTTNSCGIHLLQPRHGNRYAVFVVKEQEGISYTYERNAEDPRIAHTLNLETDLYGNILSSVTVIYPRRKTEERLKDLPSDTAVIRNAKAKTRAAQQKLWVSYTSNDFTNDIISPFSYLLRKGWNTKTYEITGQYPTIGIFQLSELTGVISSLAEIGYHQAAAGDKPQKRLVEQGKNKYYNDELDGPMPDGQLSAWGLAYESYQLAYTPDLLEDSFSAGEYTMPFEVTDAMMLEGKYILDDANWWLRSGTMLFRRPGDTLETVRDRFISPVAYIDPFDSKLDLYYDPLHLYLERSVDELGNETKVIEFNFRTLSPVRMMDMNDNINAVILDELGLVKAASAEGKDTDGDLYGNEADHLVGFNEFADAGSAAQANLFFEIVQSAGICDYTALRAAAKDLLKSATTVSVYKFDQLPAVVASISREQHDVENPDSPLQISFEYSDGFGHVAMTKIQAEPGVAKVTEKKEDGSWKTTEVDTGNQLRWIGNGRTVINNKGNPVKQYESYFSVSPVYEEAEQLIETGVSPLLYYDVAGRLIRTAYPNGTFTRIVFDAWKQVSYDVNDTVKDSEWYHSRILLSGQNKENDAAQKAAMHADTPACVMLDTLGRPVLGIDHNRTIDSGGSLKEEFFYTFSEMDIEGNVHRIIDARGNTVMEYRYDLLGNRVFQSAADAGKRWSLNNSLGKPLKTWDERGFEFSIIYDKLHRPLKKIARGGDGPLPVNFCYESIVYGENRANDKQRNLRGRVAVLYDTAGRAVHDRFDFKGNMLSVTFTFTKEYKWLPDWNLSDPDILLEGGIYTFTTVTAFDAMNRVRRQIMPDGSVLIPDFGPAALLKKMMVEHDGSSDNFVTAIAYDVKGQRTAITYGNGVKTTYQYDPLTLRLITLQSKKNAGEILQDLNYTYDPVGNITQLEDRAQPVIFFNNQKTTAKRDYSYDALYHLSAATGRESDKPYEFNELDNWKDAAYITQHAPGDPMAMRNYTQRYQYDPVGNILQMSHVAGSSGSWTRRYNYENKNNRLKTTQIGSHAWQYNYHVQHGFITSLPHLQDMGWNFNEELCRTAAQRRSDGGTAETTYYVYDGQGKRVRKVTENQAEPGVLPTVKDERLYLGSYEWYKNETGLERESLHLMDGEQRVAMIDTQTEQRKILGIPAGRTSPVKTVRYQLANHQGSSCIELDETAQIISYEEYHPFGTTAYQASNSSIKAAAKRYRYTGMERDEETGLDYHNARYYLPWLGRWLSADPAGIGDGLNVYAYCDNRVINSTDINGNWAMIVGAVLVAVVILLTVENTANAPTPKDIETGNVHKSVTDTEFLMKATVIAASGGAGGAVGKTVAAKIGGGVLARIGGSAVGGGTGGGLQALGTRAVDDMMRGKLSSPKEYIDDALKGTAAGFVIGGVMGAASEAGKKGVNMVGAGKSAPKAPAPVVEKPSFTETPNAEAAAPKANVAPPAEAAPQAAPQVQVSRAPKTKPLRRTPGGKPENIRGQHGDRVTRRSSGQVDALTAELKANQMGKGTETTKAARTSAQSQGAVYDAGHLRSNLLGGKGGLKNTFPQYFHINRGLFAQFEGRVADLVRGASATDRIFISVQPRYASPTATVADQVVYFLRINGRTVARAIFSNKPGRSYMQFF